MSSLSPLVSVVLPFHNARETLVAAVESIRAQSFQQWELLAVDDHSTDGSTELVVAAAEKDSRIRLIRANGHGIVPALNHGIDNARADWIARMDADDISYPLRLEKQMAFSKTHPDLSVIGCQVEVFPEDAVTDGMRHYISWLNGLLTPEDISKEIFVESPIAHPSALVQRRAIEEVAGYRDGPFPEDYDLWLRLHLAGKTFGKVEEILLKWRDRADRLSRTDPRYDLSSFRSLKVDALRLSFLANKSAVQVWGAGPDGKAWRRALAKVGIDVVRFFDVDPRKIGGRIGGEVPVETWENIPLHRGIPLLGAVGVKGARHEIRTTLVNWNFQEGIDFLLVQ